MRFIKLVCFIYNLLWQINIKRQTRLLSERSLEQFPFGVVGSSRKKSFYNEIALLSSGTRKIIFLSVLFPGGLPPTARHHSISVWNGGCLAQVYDCLLYLHYSVLNSPFPEPKIFIVLGKSFISLKHMFSGSISQKHKTKRKKQEAQLYVASLVRWFLRKLLKRYNAILHVGFVYYFVTLNYQSILPSKSSQVYILGHIH